MKWINKWKCDEVDGSSHDNKLKWQQSSNKKWNEGDDQRDEKDQRKKITYR